MYKKISILIISICLFILNNLFMYKIYKENKELNKQLKRNTWKYYD